MLRVIVFSLNTLLSWVMKLTLFGLLIFSIVNGLGFSVMLSVIIALICSFLPAIINHSYRVNLPWTIDFFVTLGVFLDSFGMTFNLYHTPPYLEWWDQMTHFLNIAVIASLAFFIIFTLNFVRKVKMSIPMIGFFTFVFALAIGALWEIAEFYSDRYLGTIAIIDLEDTINDMVFDSIGGAAAAILGMLYVRYRRRKHLFLTLRPLIKILTGKDRWLKTRAHWSRTRARWSSRRARWSRRRARRQRTLVY